ncbi:isocitrate/isopropylmalate dehydrogenase family protein [Saccharomonospora viridis]|jgi:isocitrate/isopropylmalate dehydrogenase|uniref:isocitrate/isopropylmalate dehydrogenase family protein n=1 Tax=Saccharomonospora viridis TaxID=1852 RepID=UPI0024A8C089|nr:isocitrate/isopropylmalate family dehydrogenase [Saccharomonospora viridis]
MTGTRIGLIRGDGIGPEIVEATVRVLDALAELHPESRGWEYVEIDAGADTYRRTGVACAEADVRRLRDEVDATLKGPVGLPDVRTPDGVEAGVLGGILRTGLDTYANIRPVRSWPGVPSRVRADRVDYVIVRENTEGLYASRGKGVGNRWAVTDTLLTTREGTLRVARKAFTLAAGRQGAPADGVRRVTCVDKSNVLRSHAFFREVVTEVAAEFPEVELEYRYADAAAQDLVLCPERFDVLVMENFLGDVLSDLGGATVGGVGLCPAGNVGDGAAYFEPVHGSAPDLVGRNRANPVGQLLAAAMLLDHLGHVDEAARLRRAVSAVLAFGTVRIEADGTVRGGAEAVADAVIAALQP